MLGNASEIHLQRWESNLREDGYETLTVSLESVDEISGPRQRIRISPLLPPFLRYPMAVPFVKRIVRRFTPDLVNAHFLPNYGLIAALIGFEPWVLSTWGSDIMRLPQRTPFHLYRTRHVIERATAITSDAETMTRRIVELGAQRDRVVTFPLGVDRDMFRPHSVSGKSERLRVLSNRKLEAVYDIETIIASFPSVLKREPGSTLTIAGAGSLAKRLRDGSARISAAKAIHFIGSVSHDLMPELLGKHDIYVSMPLSDTTSVSLLEAMACGLFPVVSDIAANHEWIVHGKNGFLVPMGDSKRLADAVIAAWEDAEMRRSAAEHNARLIEERADWRDNMNVLKRLFEQVLSRNDTDVT